MTVSELRKILKPLPDDMLVARGDNSGGYEAIYRPKTVELTNLLTGKTQKVLATVIE